MYVLVSVRPRMGTTHQETPGLPGRVMTGVCVTVVLSERPYLCKADWASSCQKEEEENKRTIQDRVHHSRRDF